MKTNTVLLCTALLYAASPLASRAASADTTNASLADLKKNALSCVTESGLTPEQLRQCCAASPTDADVLSKHKRFTYCMQNNVGILKSDGVVNPEKATLLVKPDEKTKMLEIARSCLGGDTSDLNEKAHHISDCYRTADSKMYIANCNSVLDFVLS